MTSSYTPQWPAYGPVPMPAPPRRRWWPWILAGALTVLALAGTLAAVLLTNGANTFTMEGTLSVANCTNLGYSDLVPGAQVTVTAQDGRVLGIGTVKSSYSDTTTTADDFCTRTFEVPNLPAGLGLYGVHVGNQNRGVLWENENDAHTGVYLSVGS